MSEYSEREVDHAERGALLYEQRRYDLAQKEFEAALAADPGDARAHAYLSMCLLEEGHLKAASEAARRSIEANPDGHLGFYAQARAYRRRHYEKEALAAINQALAIRPESPGYLGFSALLAADRRQWDETIRLAEQGLAHDAQDAQCHNLRALAMIRKGHIMPAREALLELLSRDPKNSLTLANLGWVGLRMGQRQEALDFFSRALAEEPEDEYAREGLMEALRMQYPLYGLVLRYMLWMSSLSDKAQWAFMIFSYYLRKALRELGNRYKKLRPLISLVLWAISIFTYLTWTARPLTSLLLRLNHYGRRVLNQDEVDESNLVGGELLGAATAALLWHNSGRTPFLVVTLVMMTIVMPTSAIYNCEKGWQRWIMQAYTSILLVIGLWSAWAIYDAPLTGPGRMLLSLYGLGLLLSQYLGNLLASVRARK